MGEQMAERLVGQAASEIGCRSFDAPGIYLQGNSNIFAGGKHYLGPHSIGKILSSKDRGTSIGKSLYPQEMRFSPRRFSSPRKP